MVVFADGGLTPQAYLDRLKRFALFYYNSSEIRQSTPTIVLELNHIRFELVPATHNVFLGYQIPNGSGGWQSTDPNDFNKKLTDKNKENAYLIKPTIRLAKCWNALNDYPFESYALEKEIVGRYFGWCANNQRDFLFHVINSWDDTWFDAQRRRDCKARAKKIVAEARALEDGGYPALAEKEVRKLLER